MTKFSNGEAPHRARKRFGQNFLVDQTVIERILRAVNPLPGQHLVEIGPGKGALTALLAEASDRLTVIELDRDLVPWLKVKFERYPGFELFQADALKFDFSALASSSDSLRIVGNLPYNISTPLIFHLLRSANLVQDMHFMLQKEVVQRLAAQPGDKAYGRLGIMVQYYCQVENLFEVPPGAFAPAPKVDSAVVRLVPHRRLPYPAQHLNTLEKLVNVAFQQRRKTLRNALKQLLPVEVIDQLPVDMGLRAENISLQSYVELSNLIGDLDAIPKP
jgi:16S rRNA (adenine1518-N6/adenine1519-N6)-dimethyltransferase